LRSREKYQVTNKEQATERQNGYLKCEPAAHVQIKAESYACNDEKDSSAMQQIDPVYSRQNQEPQDVALSIREQHYDREKQQRFGAEHRKRPHSAYHAACIERII
jgi:hypothetical protein